MRCSPNWKDLTPEQRLQTRLDAWQNMPVPFASPEVKQTYGDRVQLWRDAIALKKPAHVPIAPWIALFPMRYAGYTGRDGYYDYEKLGLAWDKYHEDFQPDALAFTLTMVPGKLFDILDYKLYDWPGHGTDEDTSYQYNEKRVDEARRVRPAHRRPLGLLAALLPAARLRRARAVEHAGAVHRPRGGPLHGAVLRRLRGAAGARRCSEDHGGRATPPWSGCRPSWPSTASPWPRWASRSWRAAPPRRPTTSSATRCAARAGSCSTSSGGRRSSRRPGAPCAAGHRLGGALQRRQPASPGVHPHPQGRRRLHVSDADYREFYWPTLQGRAAGPHRRGPRAPGVRRGRLQRAPGGDRRPGHPQGPHDLDVRRHRHGRARSRSSARASASAATCPARCSSRARPSRWTPTSQRPAAGRRAKDGGFLLSTGIVLDEAEPANFKAFIDAGRKYGADI